MKRLSQTFGKGLFAGLMSALVLTGCMSAPVKKTEQPKITQITQDEVQPANTAAKTEAVTKVQKLDPAIQPDPVEIDPKTQQQFNTAMDFMAGQRYDDAERVLLEISQAHPELSGPFVNLAIIYAEEGMLDRAEQMLQQAIRANPVSAPAHNQYGILLRTLGRFEDARASYQNALIADPRFANAHLNLGVLHDLYLQDPQTAIGHYQQFQELSGSEDKMVNIWITDLSRRYGDKRSATRQP